MVIIVQFLEDYWHLIYEINISNIRNSSANAIPLLSFLCYFVLGGTVIPHQARLNEN
ncbi:MAG: hypothetical protein ACK57R_07310 [Dolichospermum sp.]